ncbi:MAG: double zinc ribbon domain-containing protein [Candidatus Natronoplasma sp.]
MSTDLLIILSIIIFAVLSLFAYFYLERTKKRRLNKIKRKSELSPEDEVYNRVKRTKGLTSLMKRKGKNVQKADEMVNKAERALEKGDISQAKDLASKAKNGLYDKKTSYDLPDQNENVKKAYTVDELDQVEFKESEDAERKRRELKKQREKLESLPDNFLESKFEMKLARELLDETDHGKKAKELYSKAEKCFDEEDYTGALKYSIKCKKTIKGKEGAGLIAGQDIDKKEGPSEEVKEHFPDLVKDKEKAEESVVRTIGKAETEIKDEKTRSTKGKLQSEMVKTCPECGFEGGEDDFYCPSCGLELITESECPECGNEVEEGDEFCRKCGTSLGSSSFVCPECGVEVEQDDEFCPKCGIEFDE